MVNEIDWDFHSAYPTLYPICSMLEIKKEVIDSITEKIWSDWKLNLKYNKKETQLILRVIIARLDKINERLDDLYKYRNASDEVLIEVFGIRQIDIVKAIA